MIIVGFHSIEEAVKSGSEGTLYISGKGPRIKRIVEIASKRKGVGIEYVPKARLDKISNLADHRGIVFDCVSSGVSRYVDLKGFLKEERELSRVLVLDSITDPHNFGAILRSADKFGVNLVIVRERRSVRDSLTVSKTSAGAINYVPICVVSNLNSAIELLQEAGYWVYGADISGSSLTQESFSSKVAVVMGSEGSGISALTKAKCDSLLTIPTCGNVDSLNVSVATGVILYELYRQSL